MVSPLKQLRYRIEWLAIKLMSVIVPLLPRRGILWLANALGCVAFRFDAEGRRTALANLASVFGETHSEEQRREIAKQAYRDFARTMLDQFWSSRLNAENYLNYVEIETEDPEAIDRARNNGAIWVTPHYGNFEWTSLVMGFRGFPFTVVAQDFKNPLLTDLFNANREVSGHRVIPQSGAMLRLFKNLKAGGHAAFLTDLTIKPGRNATIIDCFGLKTCVTTMHAGLQQKLQLPIIPGFTTPLPNGKYQLNILAPLKLDDGASDQEIVQACWDAFEAHIRKNPSPWLWMYKHWRYIPEESGENYPPYARVSSAFRLEKRLKDN
ncbi:MAG: lysophospholipid acyltransferase family protein [Verrucomicrobia bacterium]|nr:lysophospholipid acyltransferase family protein [Verrucomicrobiota bacterium]